MPCKDCANFCFPSTAIKTSTTADDSTPLLIASEPFSTNAFEADKCLNDGLFTSTCVQRIMTVCGCRGTNNSAATILNQFEYFK